MVGPAAMALGQFMVNGLFTLLTAELEGRAYYSSSDAQLHHGQARVGFVDARPYVMGLTPAWLESYWGEPERARH